MYLPLEKSVALQLNKLEFRASKNAFLPNLAKISYVILEKKMNL